MGALVRVGVVGATALLVGAGGLLGCPPLGAAVVPIQGDMTCGVTGAQLTFAPATKAGNSSARLTATVGSCVDPSHPGPPGGLDHGVLDGRGRVTPRGDCRGYFDLHMRTKITWYDANGRKLSQTRLTADTNELWDGIGFPDLFRFVGIVRTSSPAFADKLATVMLTTTAPHSAVVSAKCATPAQPVFPMVSPGVLTIRPA